MSLGIRVEDPLQTISHLLTAYSNVHTLEFPYHMFWVEKKRYAFLAYFVILC